MTLVNELQPSKHLNPIEVILLGIVIVVNELQPLKRLFEKFVKVVLGAKFTFVNLLHPSKTLYH